jgi:hypothetical protein
VVAAVFPDAGVVLVPCAMTLLSSELDVATPVNSCATNPRAAPAPLLNVTVTVWLAPPVMFCAYHRVTSWAPSKSRIFV